jgi:dTMP kinase
VARGCDRQWIRRLYSYARHPDLTFLFDVPLTVALKRISTGRFELKFYEAGMDMGLAKDPFESFQIFQGRVYDEYQHMLDEFGFVRLDATRAPGMQQREVRELLQKHINLPQYRWKIQPWGLPR